MTATKTVLIFEYLEIEFPLEYVLLVLDVVIGRSFGLLLV